MGNCLRSEGKVVKIMKTDGKIVEYKASIKVEEVLSEFKGHALSEMLPVQCFVKPNTELVAGRLYHLMPELPIRSPKVGKMVRFSEPESTQLTQAGVGDGKNSLRIKLVISRQELKVMLANGIVSFKDVGPELQKNGTEIIEETDECFSNQTWTPSLKCIPEVEL